MTPEEKQIIETKTRKIEEILTKIDAVAASLRKTSLTDRQQGYVEKMEHLNERLRQETETLRSGLFVQNRAELSQQVFTIKALLEECHSALYERLPWEGMRWIYEIDSSVPPVVRSYGELLKKLLLSTLSSLVDLRDAGEIRIDVCFAKQVEKGKEPLLHIDLGFEPPLDERRRGEVKKKLQDIPEIGRALRDLREIGGTLGMRQAGQGPLYALRIPARGAERRSYRLPSASWMNKKMFVIVSDEEAGERLEGMLGYFHFQVHRARSLHEALPELGRDRYDMIILDSPLFEEFKKHPASLKIGSKVTLLCHEGEDAETKYGAPGEEVDSYLVEPFTQQKIFDLLLELYSRESPDGVQEILKVYRENLSLLLTGKHVLYIGAKNDERVTTEYLLRSAGIPVIGAETHHRASIFIDRADMILLSDYLEPPEWEAVLRMCRKFGDSKAILALLHDETNEKIEALRSVGIETHLNFPLDPERFYRKVMDLMFEE